MWFIPGIRIRTRRRRRAPKGARRSRASIRHYEEHKEHARALVHEKLAHWNQYYNCTYNRVAIKNLRSRWGSCSSKQNLNFNYRIVFLPEALIDYIIVHELCHLIEFNHSSTFWEHVARTIPDHYELKSALRAISSNYIHQVPAGISGVV